MNMAIEKLCGLCGLSVGNNPFSNIFDEIEKQFCCLGCLNVYTILSESGVIASGQDVRDTELFKRSLELGLISNRKEKEKDFEIPPDAPTRETLLHVSGMWCSACSWLIEHSLNNERGVISAEAFFASDLVKVKYCPQFLPPERLTKRIEQLGYKASEYDPDNETSKTEKRDLVLRIGVSAFLWMNIMTFGMALYVGYFEEISESVRYFFPFMLAILAAPVLLYSAHPINHLAWTGLKNKTIRMETLLATGIWAAYIYSIIQAFRGDIHVYFDTAAAIVTLVLLGKLMEKGAKERTTRSISMLYRLMPKKVRLFVENTERFVSIDALNLGDVFLVKAGERIPADGIVIEGESHTDESLLTGESTPISKKAGSNVVSGSLNVGNVLQIQATKIGQDTTLSQIIKLVESAVSSRSNLERIVDKVSRIFVPSVIFVAILTFAVLWGFGFTTLEEGLMRAITILVIACPCALGLATPLAITAAVGSSSQNGILVSDSSVLEKVRNLDVVIFDKTGTITEGKFDLLEVALTDENTDFDKDYLPLIASLEKFSEHPLGNAVIRYAQGRNANVNECVSALETTNVEILKGLGIIGNIDGKNIFVGNQRLISEKNIEIDKQLEQKAHEWEAVGKTVAFFGFDNELKGIISFGDLVKNDAKEIISELKQRNIKTVIVSGDSTATTQYVANLVGADDFRAGALPIDKTNAISELQQKGLSVAMIGDGINDAPALAQADLGIAMGSGTDIAMKAADIVLMSNNLEKILTVFDLSKKTFRVVRQNLFWAFFYNTMGMSLAITGILNPILAAGAMLLSSLSVIGNSMRLNIKKNP
ncbi:MAG: cation-translocating P-type ATPase [Pyrinomonadaceae bacterium]|nr:cation-translocating P-type ATPase [Pyrinomonadaceae bacterium]